MTLRPQRRQPQPLPPLPLEQMVEAVNNRDLTTLMSVVSQRDLQIQQRVTTEVRQAIRRLVLPAFVIAGLGICGSLLWQWLAERDRVHDQCVAAADARDAFRTFAYGQQDQWNTILGIFPSDDPSVQEVQGVVDANTATIDPNFPIKDRGKC